MKTLTIRHLTVFLTLAFIAENSVAFNCDTTLIANDPSQDYNDQVYLADCRIKMQESSPFIISPGHQAQLTAEQQIRLGPGFHAQSGSHFHAQLRDCIRNPDKNTGYAAWGEPDLNDPDHPRWIEEIAEKFVDNFSDLTEFTVELKYDGVDSLINIPDLYKDSTGRDDDDSYTINQGTPFEQEIDIQGIDKGVFFFHAGHGSGIRGPVGRDGNRMFWTDWKLGNCSSDGTKSGELRYLFVCSCRSFAHGPAASSSAIQYDRPSEFDPNHNTANTANPFSNFLPDYANVFERLGPVLSDNMRMACGSSTSAHCNVINSPDSVVDHMISLYYYNFYKVADAWGYASADYTQGGGAFKQTHLCIARGNFNIDDLRSPITDDQFFTEKANPYDEALHIKSWEGVLTAGNWNLTEHEDVEGLEEHLRTLPIFLTSSSSPSTWFVEESNTLTNIDQINTQNFQNQFSIHNNRLISKNMTNEGVPKVIVDTKSGAIFLSRDRKPVSVSEKDTTLSLKKYANIARNFIDKQGWSENDVGDISVVSGMLQVKPLDPQVDNASTLLKVQTDIAFFVGRRIPLGKVSPKVLGSDNQIVVQMNNDGSIKSASKSWRKITQKIEGVPVKSYETAYTEAVKQLGNPGLYELSTWDWGYKSITDDSRQDMMIVYYVFTFEPLSIINACIDMPRVIEIQGHILEKKGNHDVVYGNNREVAKG